MQTIEAPDRYSYRRMTTDELRQGFVIETLFQPDKAHLVYTNVDRAVVGGIVPGKEEIELAGSKEMASTYFCERREAGIINLGSAGTVIVDGTAHKLAPRECLYIRRGSRGVIFVSDHPDRPAFFYLVSYPAYTEYPTVKAGLKDANRIDLGALETSNRRTVYQYIRPGFIESCQLIMGFTELHAGSVWNSFPPHTHDRRTAVYCYFDLPPDAAMMHFLGEPHETRHVTLRGKQAVLAPPWSVHCGVGTSRYSFVWAMGGENQELEDTDKCDLAIFR